MTTKTTTNTTFRAGQTVHLATPRRGAEPAIQEVVIGRVGRKYAYITSYDGEAAFDLATGREKGGAYYYQRRILTAEQLAAEQHRNAVLLKLRRVATKTYWWERLTTDQAERINAILAEGQSWPPHLHPSRYFLARGGARVEVVAPHHSDTADGHLADPEYWTELHLTPEPSADAAVLDRIAAGYLTDAAYDNPASSLEHISNLIESTGRTIDLGWDYEDNDDEERS